MNYHISKKSILSVALAIVCLSLASTGAAQTKTDSRGNEVHLENNWHYGCFPEQETAIGEFPPPNILLMLDVSGSMNETGGARTTKLERAAAAVKTLLDTNKQASSRIADFGLAQFTQTSSDASSGTYVINDCSTGNDSEIEDSVDDLSAFGGTPTDYAIEVSKNSSCIQHPKKNQSAATALITDGSPRSRRTALTAACKHRKVAPLYVIGLGSGTDKRFNNVLAAAGGSGTCMGLDGRAWDPCDHISDDELKVLMDFGWFYYNKKTGGNVNTCRGAFSTTNTDELVTAFRSIVADVSCNFPLNTVGLPASVPIPTDSTGKYPWIQVGLNQKWGGSRKVLNVNDPAAQTGWTWTFTNESRKTVTLGKAACDAIKYQKIRSVKTRVGCICEKQPGSQCGGKSIGSVMVCQPGTYACDRGLGLCNSTTEDSVSDLPCQNSKYGICKYGHYACENGDIICKSDLGPLPEVCNGIDDDCNGVSDDITTSWDDQTAKYQPEIKKLASRPAVNRLYRNQACEVKDACSCLNNTPPIFTPVPPKNASVLDTYEYYTNAWPSMHGSCTCQPQ